MSKFVLIFSVCLLPPEVQIYVSEFLKDSKLFCLIINIVTASCDVSGVCLFVCLFVCFVFNQPLACQTLIAIDNRSWGFNKQKFMFLQN